MAKLLQIERWKVSIPRLGGVDRKEMLELQKANEQLELFPSPDWGELIESVSLLARTRMRRERFSSPDWGELIESLKQAISLNVSIVSIPRLGGVDRKTG